MRLADTHDHNAVRTVMKNRLIYEKKSPKDVQVGTLLHALGQTLRGVPKSELMMRERLL